MNLMDLIEECEKLLLNEENNDEEIKENNYCNDGDNYEVEYLSGDSNNRKFKKYNKAGKVISEGEYIHGVKYGKEYDKKGNVIFKGQYSNNQRYNGRKKEFYENGKLKFDGQYIIGDKKGKKYDIDGNVALINENQNMNEFEKYKDSWEGYMNSMISIMGGVITGPKNDNDIQYKDDNKKNFGEEFISNKIAKEKIKIYDNNNNFLFEFDDKILPFFQKKKILFEKYKTYKDKNGLTFVTGREINFKKDSIFEGDFLNGEKWKGSIRIYNNLNIEENKNIHYLKAKKSNIIIFESQYIKGEINGKVKEYNNDGYLIFDGECVNGVKKGIRKEYNKLEYLIFIGDCLNDKKIKIQKFTTSFGKSRADMEK